MLVDKTEIDCEKMLMHCTENIFNGNYGYLTYVTVHANQLNAFFEWLHSCENANQDYFLMYFETEQKYKKLCGCSSFRMPTMYNIESSRVEMKGRDENEIIRILSMWSDFCSCYYISEAVKPLCEKDR